MKLKISKKNLYILIPLLLLLVTITLMLLFSPFGDNEGYYQFFNKQCDSRQEKGSVIFECEAFITSERLKEQDSTRCLTFLFYTDDSISDPKELCLSSSVVKWDNPYQNYDKYVPVNLKVTFKQVINQELVNVSATLMPDEQFIEIMEALPDQADAERRLWRNTYIREQQRILEDNYYLTGMQGSGVTDLLAIYDAQIDSISTNADQVVILGNTVLKNSRIEFEMRAKTFEYSSFLGIEDEILVDKDHLVSLDRGDRFSLTLKFETEDMDVDSYINSWIENSSERIFLTENFATPAMFQPSFEHSLTFHYW